MLKKPTLKPVAAAIGAVALTSLAAMPVAYADSSPFGLTDLGSGYQVAKEGSSSKSKSSMPKKMGEGKCGADKMDKGKEGKCGDMKAKDSMPKKMGEGKCGAGKMDKGKEGKCGDMKAKPKPKAKEGKCGEGKCGGKK